MAALALAWSGLADWIQWSLAAYLWIMPAVILPLSIILGLLHHLFGKFPPDRPSGPPQEAECEQPSPGWHRRFDGQWPSMLALLTAGLLIFGSRYLLSAAFILMVFMSREMRNQMAVARSNWDSRVLPPFARARYVGLGLFYHHLWSLLRLGRFPFVGIRGVWRRATQLFGLNRLSRKFALTCGAILSLPILPLLAAWMLYCGIRDSRALRCRFDRPKGLIYFVYAEAGQFEHFLGEAGILGPVRSMVVPRDWHRELACARQRPDWNKSPEGRMLNHLSIRNPHVDLPLIVIARPWRPAEVHPLGAAYGARDQNPGADLEQAESKLKDRLRWVASTQAVERDST